MEYRYNLGLAFYSVAGVHSKRKALSYPDGSQLTYGQLNQLSNRLGHFLHSSDIRRGDVVAIFNDKSPTAYGLMLACLKIGAIYTNLDNSSPWERIRKIITRCTPKAIFFDSAESRILKEVRPATGEVHLHFYRDPAFEDSVAAFDDDNLEETGQVHGGDAAYIMFTSGSTGFPKGAVMSHSNVLNFVQWGQQTFNIKEDDTFTNVNPIYFDNSVFDFYTSLFSGASLVPLDGELVKDTSKLVKAINSTGCTIWFSVPSLLVYLLTTKALKKNDFPSVRRIAFGGEGFPKNKLKQLFTLYGDRITLFNVYGPTECTCICSSYVIGEKDFENMSELAPLGYLAPNFGYEILAVEESNPDFGELGLTGPCVGLGYFNDTELTQKAFVSNPRKSYQERMYKTGDLVERAANGYLHFKGRIDNQIKHMGYRIELEEIEAAFSSLEYINEVGVVYERITPDLGQIKAFVTLSGTQRETSQILEDVKAILPPYMVPKIMVVDSLPKNRNGKIDRKQLVNNA